LGSENKFFNEKIINLKKKLVSSQKKNNYLKTGLGIFLGVMLNLDLPANQVRA
jgi:hypothetical protein